MLDDSGREMNIMQSQCLCICFMQWYKYNHASWPGIPSGYCYAFRMFSLLFPRNALRNIQFSRNYFCYYYSGRISDYILQLCDSGTNHRVHLLLETFPGAIVTHFRFLWCRLYVNSCIKKSSTVSCPIYGHCLQNCKSYLKTALTSLNLAAMQLPLSVSKA